MHPRAEIWVGGGIAVVGIALQPLVQLGQALGMQLTELELHLLLILTLITPIAGVGMVVHGFGMFRWLRRLRIRSPIVIDKPPRITASITEPIALPGVTGTTVLHTGPPIPIPKFDLEIRRQNPVVYIAVINNIEQAVFRAQVIEVRGVKLEPAVPWSIPWREDGTLERTLARGETQLLALGRGDGMGNLADQSGRPRKPLRVGLFHFRTADGEATVEMSGLERIEDLYRTGFSVRIRIYCGSESQDFVARLGFLNEVDATGTLLVQVTVGHWESR